MSRVILVSRGRNYGVWTGWVSAGGAFRVMSSCGPACGGICEDNNSRAR